LRAHGGKIYSLSQPLCERVHNSLQASDWLEAVMSTQGKPLPPPHFLNVAMKKNFGQRFLQKEKLDPGGGS